LIFENLVILWIAIEKVCPPETAFKYFDKALNSKQGRPRELPYFSWTPEDIQDLLAFREKGLTYKEIGSYYGVSDHSIFVIIKRQVIVH